MRILILTNYFPPETGSASQLFFELAETLGERGHAVTVVTGFPRYLMARGERGLFRHDRVGKTPVIRVMSSPFGGRGPYRRGLDHLYVATSLFLGGLFAGRADVVLIYSPPLTLGASAWALSRLWRIPYVVNVQDLFPQYAIDLKLLKNPRLIHAFQALERFIYRTAGAIAVISPGNREYVISHGAPAQRVRVISNWADTTFIQPGPRDNHLRERWGTQGKFVVQYSGVMGYSHDLDTVMQAASLLKTEQDICFHLNGEGVERARLERKARELELPNVFFTFLQPRELYPAVLQSADVCLVSLHPEVKTPTVPSKIFSIMAAAKPVIVSSDRSGDIAALVDSVKCGLWVPPGEPERLAQAILTLKRDTAGATIMGANGRQYVEREGTRELAALRYESVLQNAIQEFGKPGAPGRDDEADSSGKPVPSALVCGEALSDSAS